MRVVTLLTAILMGVFPLVAYARCDVVQNPTNTTITCNTSTEGGLEFSGQDHFNMTVSEGVSVSGPDTGLALSTRYMNLGNDGVISGGRTGIALLPLKDGNEAIPQELQIGNRGSIRGQEVAISVTEDPARDRDVYVSVYNGGDFHNGAITSAGVGIQLGERGFVNNKGSIISTGDAVRGGSGTSVANYRLIESAQGDGVRTAVGDASNYGHIRALNGAAIRATQAQTSTVYNFHTGRLEGEVGIDHRAAGVSNIHNYGHITGHGGVAVRASDGADTLSFWGGSLQGSVELGAGDDRLQFGRDLLGGMSGEFAGGGILDGGDGHDLVNMGLYSDSISDIYYERDVLHLETFAAGEATLLMRFRGFEVLRFYDLEYEVEDPAPVPLPSGILFLIGALGAGMGLRRLRL